MGEFLAGEKDFHDESRLYLLKVQLSRFRHFSFFECDEFFDLLDGSLYVAGICFGHGLHHDGGVPTNGDITNLNRLAGTSGIHGSKLSPLIMRTIS